MNAERYATVMPASGNRSGWMVCAKIGGTIKHTRLENASIHDPEAARAAAQSVYPERLIWVAGDTGPKPWETPDLVAVPQ